MRDFPSFREHIQRADGWLVEWMGCKCSASFFSGFVFCFEGPQHFSTAFDVFKSATRSHAIANTVHVRRAHFNHTCDKEQKASRTEANSLHNCFQVLNFNYRHRKWWCSTKADRRQAPVQFGVENLAVFRLRFVSLPSPSCVVQFVRLHRAECDGSLSANAGMQIRFCSFVPRDPNRIISAST